MEPKTIKAFTVSSLTRVSRVLSHKDALTSKSMTFIKCRTVPTCGSKDPRTARLCLQTHSEGSPVARVRGKEEIQYDEHLEGSWHIVQWNPSAPRRTTQTDLQLLQPHKIRLHTCNSTALIELLTRRILDELSQTVLP